MKNLHDIPVEKECVSHSQWIRYFEDNPVDTADSRIFGRNGAIYLTTSNTETQFYTVGTVVRVMGSGILDVTPETFNFRLYTDSNT